MVGFLIIDRGCCGVPAMGYDFWKCSAARKGWNWRKTMEAIALRRPEMCVCQLF